MNFKVVGFYQPDVSFYMEAGAKHEVSFDYAVVLPYFSFDYVANDEDSIFQQVFLTADRTSGYIAIKELFEDINEELFEKYTAKVEKMAEKNGLSGLYKYPYRPVGFVWSK